MQKIMYLGRRFEAPKMSAREYFAGLAFAVLGIDSKTARRARRARREAWERHVNQMQKELDAQSARGWGWSPNHVRIERGRA